MRTFLHPYLEYVISLIRNYVDIILTLCCYYVFLDAEYVYRALAKCMYVYVYINKGNFINHN